MQLDAEQVFAMSQRRRIHLVCATKSVPTLSEWLEAHTGEEWSIVDPHDDGEKPNGWAACSAAVTAEQYERLTRAIDLLFQSTGGGAPTIPVFWSDGASIVGEPTKPGEKTHSESVGLFLSGADVSDLSDQQTELSGLAERER